MVLTEAQLRELSTLAETLQGLPETARAEWLANLSAEQEVYRTALQRLLPPGSGPDVHDFLATLPKLRDFVEADPSGIVAGTEIGPYRLLRELGRGGMGTVWLAEQSDGGLKRSVALKLPHRQLTERFAREREILAELSHPNIARLYDAGVTAQGQPYLALEYVNGEPLMTWCDAKRLSVRERIELYLQALAAAQYAHERLIVHRDLKPSNMLVTAQGEVKLLDFGIAKLLVDGSTKETELTQLGGRALTPQYASPEQIRGQPLGTESDVYALGVVLFELLTGTRPYSVKTGSRAALEDAILTEEPLRASDVATNPEAAARRGTDPKGLVRTLQGDIDSILNRALKKSPDERYTNAEELSADLRMHLRGGQVRARANSAWNRMVATLRHNFITHNGTTAISVLLATGTVIGVGAALWQAGMARERSQAVGAANGLLGAIFSTNVSIPLDKPEESEGAGPASTGTATSQIRKNFTAAPLATLRILGTIAATFKRFGLDENAIELARNRIELARRVDKEGAPDLVDALLQFANLNSAILHTDEAVRALNEAEAILDRRHDTSSTLRGRLESARGFQTLVSDEPLSYAHFRKAASIFEPLGNSAGEDLVWAMAMQANGLILRGDNPDAQALISRATKLGIGDGPSFDDFLNDAHEIVGSEPSGIGDSANVHFTFNHAAKDSGSSGSRTDLRGAVLLATFQMRNSLLREALAVLEGPRMEAIRLHDTDDQSAVALAVLITHARVAREYGQPEVASDDLRVAASLRPYEGNARLRSLLYDQHAALALAADEIESADKWLRLQRETNGQLGPPVQLRNDTTELEIETYLAEGRVVEAESAYAMFTTNPLVARRATPTDLRDEVLRAKLDLAAGRHLDVLKRLAAVNGWVEKTGGLIYLRKYMFGVALLEGYAAQAQMDHARARDAFERAIAIAHEIFDPMSPALAEAQIGLAGSELHLGNKAAAIILIRNAKQIRSNHPRFEKSIFSRLREVERLCSCEDLT